MSSSVDYYETLRTYCRKSYLNFLKVFCRIQIKQDMIWNWHIPILAGEFEKQIRRVAAGEPWEYDVVTNITPGTTKSIIFSIHAVPWAWTICPHIRFIGASFTDPLALDLSTKSREIVESSLYRKLFPEIVLKEDKNRASHWGNTLGGERYAATVGGSVMGMHGDIISIDDPLDPQQGRSKQEIDTAKQWCNETIMSRKTNKLVTSTFLTMQRIAQDDPTAVFLNRGTPVKHYCFPGEISNDVRPRECRKYYIDGLFDVNRLPRSVLNRMRLEMGAYAYSGQVLQNPIPPEGGMFETQRLLERIKHAPPEQEFVKIVRFWDKAITDGSGCFTAGVKMGLHRSGAFWVLDVARGQWGADKREAMIKGTALSDGRSCWVYMEEEGGSAGKLDSLMSIRNLAGFKVIAQRPRGSKELRADTFSAQVNGGNVWLALGSWVSAYVEELSHFPNSTYKDQVDASGGAFGNLWKKTKVGAL